ncbi:PTS transporter subunit EIIC [Escherichia coli]
MTFALVPVTAVKYTYTVIPALVMTWCLSYIEGWVDRITPAVTKNFLKPMLIVLIAAPLAILFIGPVGIWIGTAISGSGLHGPRLPGLAVGGHHGAWPLLVMTGMHRVFTPTIIQTIAETGKEGMVMPSEIGANLSLGGSSLAVAARPQTRNCARRRSRRPLRHHGGDLRTRALRCGPAPQASAHREPHQRLCLRCRRRHGGARQPLMAAPGSLPACSSSIRPTP